MLINFWYTVQFSLGSYLALFPVPAYVWGKAMKVTRNAGIKGGLSYYPPKERLLIIFPTSAVQLIPHLRYKCT